MSCARDGSQEIASSSAWSARERASVVDGWSYAGAVLDFGMQVALKMGLFPGSGAGGLTSRGEVQMRICMRPATAIHSLSLLINTCRSPNSGLSPDRPLGYAIRVKSLNDGGN